MRKHLLKVNNKGTRTTSMKVVIVSLWLTLNRYLPPIFLILLTLIMYLKARKLYLELEFLYALRQDN